MGVSSKRNFFAIISNAYPRCYTDAHTPTLLEYYFRIIENDFRLLKIDHTENESFLVQSLVDISNSSAFDSSFSIKILAKFSAL